MSRIRQIAASMAVALAVTACGGAAAETSSESAAAPAAGVAAADTAAPSELTGVFDTVGAGQIDLGSLEGTDTVLWFWAPW